MSKIPLEINLAGIKISKHSKTPLYVQVYDQFREMILTKRLRAGDRLPSTRDLADLTGVSRTIITQSFEQLVLEGYLVAKSGSGTYVAEILPEYLMNTVKAKQDKLINIQRSVPEMKEFASLSPDMMLCNCSKEFITPFQRGTPAFDSFPYKIWQNVSIKVFKNFKQYHLGYEDTSGYWPLRQQVATYLRLTRAVKCEAEQVVIVTGSQQGLNLTIKCLLQPGDKVWYEDPGYQSGRYSFVSAGMEICPIPVEMDGINVDYAKLHCPDAKFAYLTPSHQYPLGVTLSLQKRLEILEWARINKLWIFEDDYDSEFRYEGKPLASLQGLDTAGNVIYSGTFSKVLFPGLRLGYLVLPSAEMVDQMQKVKAILDRQSPIIDQIIVHKFMEEGHFLRHIRKMRVLYYERQQILVKLIKEQLSDYVTLECFPGGMSLTGWLSDQVNIPEFRKQIEKHGLVVPIIEDYVEKHKTRAGISLGYTGFSKFKLKTAVEKLKLCIHNSLNL